MSKKWMAIAGVVVLVAVVLGTTLWLTSRKTSVAVAPVSGATSNTSEGATESATSSVPGTGGVITLTPGDVGTPNAVGAPNGAGTSTSKNTGGGSGPTPTTGALTPFPAMPDPNIPAEKLTSPAEPGKTLPPLTEAPDPTTSGLKLGMVPDGAQYQIVIRPYGIGPSIVFGSRLVVRVDSVKPSNSTFADTNVLVLVDTTHGGTITKGGTYNATLTFRSDGTKLLPIISQATAAN